jgi:hypothetical protein
MSNSHQKIIKQNLGNFSKNDRSQNNKNVIMRKAADLIKSDVYLKNWFGADGYFGTEYKTGILKNVYFITCDHWMNSLIYSVKLIKDDCIETLAKSDGDRFITSIEEAKELIKNHAGDQL